MNARNNTIPISFIFKFENLQELSLTYNDNKFKNTSLLKTINFSQLHTSEFQDVFSRNLSLFLKHYEENLREISIDDRNI